MYEEKEATEETDTEEGTGRMRRRGRDDVASQKRGKRLAYIIHSWQLLLFVMLNEHFLQILKPFEWPWVSPIFASLVPVVRHTEGRHAQGLRE